MRNNFVKAQEELDLLESLERLCIEKHLREKQGSPLAEPPLDSNNADLQLLARWRNQLHSLPNTSKIHSSNCDVK